MSSQSLRKRAPAAGLHHDGAGFPGSSTSGQTSLTRLNAALVAPKMLQGSPQHHGLVMKLHVSPIYCILPRFVQRLISKWWILSWMAPRWETRYLILLGSFLYKFKNDSSPTDSPKGTPLPVESVDSHLVSVDFDDLDVGEALHDLPTGYSAVFVVSTLRKRHIYATPSRDQSLAWVNSIRQARHETITRNMGHAPTDSYPEYWEYFDRLGQNLMDKKDRIKAKMEDKFVREMEMTAMSDGGPLPRGYFG